MSIIIILLLLIDDQELKRPFTRAAFDPFICMHGLGKTPSGQHVDDPMSDDDTENEDAILSSISQDHLKHGGVVENSLIIMDGMMPPEVEEVVRSTFDRLSPALQTTKKLEDKVLRIIFSIGIDVVIVDAGLSSFLDKLRLKPEDLVTSNVTDKIFGRFYIPDKVQSTS